VHSGDHSIQSVYAAIEFPRRAVNFTKQAVEPLMGIYRSAIPAPLRGFPGGARASRPSRPTTSPAQDSRGAAMIVVRTSITNVPEIRWPWAVSWVAPSADESRRIRL
jgi:hypothetical protein